MDPSDQKPHTLKTTKKHKETYIRTRSATKEANNVEDTGTVTGLGRRSSQLVTSLLIDSNTQILHVRLRRNI